MLPFAVAVNGIERPCCKNNIPHGDICGSWVAVDLGGLSKNYTAHWGINQHMATN